MINRSIINHFTWATIGTEEQTTIKLRPCWLRWLCSTFTLNTLLEPVPPPSPYWGCSEGRILPLPTHSLHRWRLRWVHIATSYTDGPSGNRRGSRCLMSAGHGQQRKTRRFRVGLGTFRKLPLPSFLMPHLLAMAPPSRTPSSWQPRLTCPSPFWALINHPLQPPLLSYHLRRALACGWFPPPSPSPIPGAFPGPTPSLHTGTGASSTPRPPSPKSGKPAVSEPS